MGGGDAVPKPRLRDKSLRLPFSASRERKTEWHKKEGLRIFAGLLLWMLIPVLLGRQPGLLFEYLAEVFDAGEAGLI